MNGLDRPPTDIEIATIADLGIASTNARADFETFYRAFVSRLVRFLIWHGASLAEAADLAQDTMIQAWRYWPDIQHPETWTRVAAVRAMVRRTASILREEPVPDVPDRSALLSAADVNRWEQRYDIVLALTELPLRQRQVMAWTLDEYKPTEIANILGITPEAVRSNLKKARRSVAAHLSATRGNDD